jgi:hypothetical protein
MIARLTKLKPESQFSANPTQRMQWIRSDALLSQIQMSRIREIHTIENTPFPSSELTLGYQLTATPMKKMLIPGLPPIQILAQKKTSGEIGIRKNTTCRWIRRSTEQ